MAGAPPYRSAIDRLALIQRHGSEATNQFAMREGPRPLHASRPN